MPVPHRITPGLVYLDPRKIERRRIDRGQAQKELAVEIDVAWSTMRKVFVGQGIYPDTAKKVADAFQCDVTELLAAYDPRFEPDAAAGDWLGALEWERPEFVGRGTATANGLHFYVCRLRSRLSERRVARGKFYLLDFLPDRIRDENRHALLRHLEVTERVRGCRYVSENLQVQESADGGNFWVIDRWVGGQTLADRITANRTVPGPLSLDDCGRLMIEVALGLQALHRAGILFRELAPSRILFADDDGRAVLTDFELAKLLDDSPTVSPEEWPEDPYRAPEVGGGDVDARADLYSWSRIATLALCGRLPEPGEDGSLITDAKLPKKVAETLIRCGSPARSDRPRDIDEVLGALRRAWPKLVREKSG